MEVRNVPLPAVVGNWCPGTDQTGCPNGFTHPCETAYVKTNDAGKLILMQYQTCNGEGARFCPQAVCCASLGCNLRQLVLTRHGLLCLAHARLETAKDQISQHLFIQKVFQTNPTEREIDSVV